MILGFLLEILKNLGVQFEIIPLKGLPIVTRWNLIWLKGKNLSPVAQGYLDFLKHKRKKLVEEHFHWYEQY